MKLVNADQILVNAFKKRRKAEKKRVCAMKMEICRRRCWDASMAQVDRVGDSGGANRFRFGRKVNKPAGRGGFFLGALVHIYQMQCNKTNPTLEKIALNVLTSNKILRFSRFSFHCRLAPRSQVW